MNILFITYQYRHEIICGADSRLKNILSALLQNNTVTWVACSFDSECPKYFFHDNPGLSISPAVCKTKSRILNKILSMWYIHFEKYSFKTYQIVNAILTHLEANQNLLFNNDKVITMYLAHGEFLERIKKIRPNIEVIIDTNDIQFDRYSKLYKKESILSYLTKVIHLSRYKSEEIKAYKKADRLITLSNSDTVYLKSLGCKNTIYSPTGFSINKKTFNLAKENNIVFFGAMDSISNYDGAAIFKNKIFTLVKGKIPDAKYYIAGSNPSSKVLALSGSDTIVTGYIQDFNLFFNNMKCFVCPFNISYGHRGRVYEMMALGLPCVVTSKAVDGMNLENVEGIIIRDDYEEFALEVIKILTEDQYRDRLGESNREWARNNVSIEATYQKLIAQITSN